MLSNLLHRARSLDDYKEHNSEAYQIITMYKIIYLINQKHFERKLMSREISFNHKLRDSDVEDSRDFFRSK